METYKNLTWKDIRTIVEIADNVLEETDKKELLSFGKEGYYNNVLQRVSNYMDAMSRIGKDGERLD